MPFTSFISALELKQTLSETLLIDCRFNLADPDQGLRQYLEAHIPGARYAHLDLHLSSPITANSGRHPLPDFDTLIDQIRAWGISNTTQVVAYDDAGGAYASRLWWLLRTLGHTSVAVLNGGISAWVAAAEPLESTLPETLDGKFSPKLNRDAWWDVEQLQQHLITKDCVLVDARAKERFEGVSEPIDPIAGRIPGSVNLFIAENIGPDGLIIDADSLRKNYLAVIGDTAPDHVIHSCGSGVFACFGILCMEYAGLKGSKLYPGSWSEWIRDPARKIATG